MPHNEFDALLADLALVGQLREAGDLPLAKSLTLDSARQAISKLDRRGPFFTELRPAPRQPRPAQKQPVKVDVRARVHAAVPELLNKAMALFQDGKITATQVSAVEARLHRMLGAVR